MKKITIIILAAIALIFMTCKKHSVVNVQQLMLSDENIEVAGSHATLTAKFSYPSTLQSIKMVVSETDDMTNAVETNATIDGDHLQVVVNNLWANTTYYYCLRYANKVSLADTEVKSFTTSDATLPTVETESVSEITMTSAKVGGNVTDTGGAPITERGVCYGTNHNPDLSGSHIADEGGATNDFVVSITGLTANTAYYARAYATNKVGTVYGEEKAFVTVEGGGLPTVTTKQITNISQTTATAGGTVNADGGSTVTARGVCWSTVQNPTVADSHTTDGTGIGSFTSEITELTASTTYYVRAYATNNNGTAYGDNVSFVTQSYVQHDYVDLGLPSGTLWATHNVGADAPEGSGAYFAWGETTEKDYYSWENYRYGDYWELTKYCSDSQYGLNGFTDDLTALDPEDDAATVNWGSEWCTPTKDNWNELWYYTVYSSSFNVETINDMLCLVLIGPNGNQLILPTPGYRRLDLIDQFNTGGYYMTKTLKTDSPIDAWMLIFSIGSDHGVSGYMMDSGRNFGSSVRPVRVANKETP